MNSPQRSRGREASDGWISRFAGDVFLHAGDPEDGPLARKLTSEVAWKQPPSASLRAEVSV